jgi:hypothetical protein
VRPTGSTCHLVPEGDSDREQHRGSCHTQEQPHDLAGDAGQHDSARRSQGLGLRRDGLRELRKGQSRRGAVLHVVRDCACL